jgi:Uncharacterized membrane protein (DUF2298)
VTARFVLDCYATCMRAFAHWYVVVEMLGALVLPLAWRLFRHLPDRGYCFGKILAILLVGYAFWTGTAYGLLRNELGGAVLAVLIVTVASGVAGWRMLRGTQAGRRPLVEGMRRLTPVIITTEALFLLAFGGWAVVRSWGPEANHTEQPMDLLLLSAIWTSSSFPPQDPWLAGYAISYYYFGYWLLATIARLATARDRVQSGPGVLVRPVAHRLLRRRFQPGCAGTANERRGRTSGSADAGRPPRRGVRCAHRQPSRSARCRADRVGLAA